MRIRLLAIFFCFHIGSFVFAQINVEYILNMGRHALSVDDNISAIHYFNQAIAARPQSARAYYYRGYAKFLLEDYVGAVTDCTTSIELNPFILEVYQLRALCRIHTKDFRGAIADYTHTLKKNKKDDTALFNRALCYLELQEPDSAEMGMDEFLLLKPNFYKAYMFKAQVAAEVRKDTLLALSWLDSVLVRHKEEPLAWQFKGQWAAQHEDYAQADSFLSQAITYDSEPYENYLIRAQVRHAQNRFGDALSDYDAVIERIPQHFVAHYNRALLRALVGDDNRAIEDFTFILQEEPDNVLARYNRALLREQTGDIHGAIADYSHLIKDYPNFLYGYQERAQLRRKIGDIRGALNDETVLARHHLDIVFAKPSRTTFYKVRQRNDHSLDKYDQVIASKEGVQDSIQLFEDRLLKENRHTDDKRELLPMFALTFSPVRTENFSTNAYFKDIETLGERILKLEKQSEHLENPSHRGFDNLRRRLYFSTETSEEDIDAATLHLSTFMQAQETDSLALPADYYLSLSVLHRRIYDFNRARTYADSAIAAQSQNVLPYLERAFVLALSLPQKETNTLPDANFEKSETNGTITLALADIETAIRLQSENPYIHYNKGCLNALIGNKEAAKADFDNALRLNDKLAQAYFNRALILLQLNKKEAATDDLRRAGELGLSKSYRILKQLRNEEAEKKP